jgi:hypothetical protein
MSSVGRAGRERLDLIVISDTSEYVDVTEYALEATLETGSLGGV